MRLAAIGELLKAKPLDYVGCFIFFPSFSEWHLDKQASKQQDQGFFPTS
jgi:hypothetical protein